MIIISKSLVLSAPEILHADNPLIGYTTIIDINNITATSEEPDNPATNLANDSEGLKWRASSAGEQIITITPTDIGGADYAAISRHNLGSAAIPLQLLGRRASSEPYTVLAEAVLPDDTQALLRFAGQSFESVQLKLSPGKAAPEIAVLKMGRLLVFQDGVEADYTPLPFGRVPNSVTGRSQSGIFLGRTQTGGKTESSITFTEIDGDWYREVLDPFVEAHNSAFFFVPHPATRPREVGYAAMENKPQPRFNNLAHASITFEMSGGAS